MEFLIEKVLWVILVVITISPILALGIMKRLRPVRWFYFPIAYICSFGLFVVVWTASLFINYPTSDELYGVYENMFASYTILMIPILPLTVFLLTWLIYRRFTIKTFFISLASSLLLFFIVGFAVAYSTMYLFGRGLSLMYKI